jgi:hypothetical protein
MPDPNDIPAADACWCWTSPRRPAKSAAWSTRPTTSTHRGYAARQGKDRVDGSPVGPSPTTPDVTLEAPKRFFWCKVPRGCGRPRSLPRPGAFACLEPQLTLLRQTCSETLTPQHASRGRGTDAHADWRADASCHGLAAAPSCPTSGRLPSDAGPRTGTGTRQARLLQPGRRPQPLDESFPERPRPGRRPGHGRATAASMRRVDAEQAKEPNRQAPRSDPTHNQ